MNPRLHRPVPFLRLVLAIGLLGVACVVHGQAPAADVPAEDAVLRFSGVRFEGVEPELLANLRARVSLARLKVGTGLRPSRFRYFLRILPREVDQALQPFGYYSTELDIEPSLQPGELGAQVTLRLGEPVRVRVKRLQIEGEGGADRVLSRAVGRFQPAEGAPLDHAAYESSKGDINRLLGERGYFDARLVSARVEVSRARSEASLDLLWDSGPRYRFGDTRFEGSPFRDGLLEPLVPYRADRAYRQSDLLALQQRLTDLDYFGRIDVLPRLQASPDETAGVSPEMAAQMDAGPPRSMAGMGQGDGPPAVGIDISLEPAPRNVYRAGVSYGTDSGPGLKLGYTRRWLNDRGHRLESDLLLGSERSTALLRYRIPAFERLTGWWTGRVAGRQEQFPGGRADIVEASVIRDGRWRSLEFGVGGVLQQEQFNGEGALLIYPQFSLERSRTNDPLYPTRGFKWSLLGRWGLPGLGSEVRFRQVIASALFVRGFGARSRLILRGEAGSTRSGEFERLPPSLRFFAGGDRSVRGYGYQELSPVFEGDQRIGGSDLLVGSVELEHMFTREWGAAVFVDAGNAYGGRFEPAVGTGVGLRWRSPVGPMQLDIGRGLDNPDKSFRLHIQLGPPL